MWGIEFYQLISFGRQLGFAVMGAASLWGMVFLYIAHRTNTASAHHGIFLTWMALRMRWLIIVGGALGVGAWFVLTSLVTANAHEGVTLVTSKMQVLNAMFMMTPLYMAVAGIVLVALILFVRTPSALYNRVTGFSWFYLLSFLVSAVAISYYTDLRGLPINEIVFHVFHGFHSILTLGTVLCLDFIFLSTQNAPFVQKHVFPLFPQISKVIWVGLSLDLMSTLLIFPDAITLTPRFYFAQIVVGLLIINGIFLSGALTRRILRNITEGKKEKVLFWEKCATVSGAISVTSWMAINFVDNLHDMTVSLGTLFLFYFLTIVVLIIGREIWNKLDTRAERMGEVTILS